MTLAEALRDPNLFGRFFRGKSWKAWRVFLAALFAEPVKAGDDFTVYSSCTGRTAWPAAAFIEAALIVGRRGGKSRILALIAVYLATMRDYAPYLAPGGGDDRHSRRRSFAGAGDFSLRHWLVEGGSVA
jgi:hypothetical protein